MTDDDLRKTIEQVSASMGMDFEDSELNEEEKEALLSYIHGSISKEELISIFGGMTK
jgi:hypothetical protein